MIRLLILILTLNTSMFPVSAMGNCGVMDESSMIMMSSSNASTMSDMSCDMSDGATCSSSQCISSCAASIIPLFFSSEKPLTFIVAGRHQYQTGLAYFYTLILPINTPPPLV